jgi:hypothetical protein
MAGRSERVRCGDQAAPRQRARRPGLRTLNTVGRRCGGAAANGHEAVVKLLVEKGAELQPTTAASI